MALSGRSVTYQSILRKPFEAAVLDAVAHPDILAEAKRLEPERTPTDLAHRLREHERELLAAVESSVHAVMDANRVLERLTGRAKTQAAEHSPLPRGGDAVKRSNQRLTDSPAWHRAADKARRANDRLHASLVQDAMVPHLRKWLNDLREAQEQQHWKYRRSLDDVDTSELRSPVTKQFFQETEPLNELGRLLVRMPGGSVGIAGSRGCGKSTAIHNLSQILAPHETITRPFELFHVCVAAPVEYVPRDFLMYLHEQLCEAWLTREGTSPPPLSTDPLTHQHRMTWPLATVVLPIGLTAAAIWLAVGHVSAVGMSGLGTAAPLVVALIWTAATGCLGAKQAEAVRYLREYSLETGDLDRRGSSISKFDNGSVGMAQGRLSVLIPLLLTVLASCLIVLYSAQWLAWFDLRHVVALLLLAAGLVAVLCWTRLGLATTLEKSVVAIAAESSAAAGFASLVPQGLGLLATSRIYAPTPTLIVAGALGATAACLSAMRGVTPKLSVEAERVELVTARSIAERDLRRLRFQRTQGSGWSAAAKFGSSPYLPVNLESGVTSSTSHVEVPMTTPAITAAIQCLLRQIRAEHPEETFKIIIAIDELDKLAGEEGARTFLNEVKSIFATPGCLFVVSVSEDAMASFERRGLAFRDVFDSAFDEIVHIPPLVLNETRSLVGRRISNLPRPYAALAHCLSGGLARDVIRAIDHMAGSERPQHLQNVTRSVVHRELRGKWQAVVAAIRAIPLEPQVTDLLKALYQLDRCPGAASDPQRCVMRPAAFDLVTKLQLTIPSEAELAQFRTLQRLGGEYLGFAYFCRTLVDFFDLSGPKDIEQFMSAEAADRFERASIDYLARARQHLGVNPRLAWEQVAFFRGAHAMTVMDFPVSLLGWDQNTRERVGASNGKFPV